MRLFENGCFRIITVTAPKGPGLVSAPRTGAPPPEGPGPGGTVRRQEARGTASESELRGLRRWEGKGVKGGVRCKAGGTPALPIQEPGVRVQRLGPKGRGVGQSPGMTAPSGFLW